MSKSSYVDGSVYSNSEFAAYAAAVRQRESSNNYAAVNDSKHLGAYQPSSEGSNPGLQAAGFQDAQGNWTALAKSLGVNSVAAFLASPAAQDIAFQNYTEKNFAYLRNYQSYVGKTIGGIYITEAGLLAAAHLVGAGSLEAFLRSNGQKMHRDKNGTPLTEYLQNFSQYSFTFPANASGFSAAVNTPPTPEPGQHNNTASNAGENALEGKTPVERARHYAAQARADAAKAPFPAYMQMYDWLMKLSPQLPSVAPIAGRAGQQKTALPPRAGASDAAGLPARSRAADAGAPSAAGNGAEQGATATGFRKIIADANAQAAQAKAQRDAGRATIGLPRQGGDVLNRSFAPIPRSGAASATVPAASPETSWQQEALSAGAAGPGSASIPPSTAGQLSPQTTANAASAHPQPGQDGNAHPVWQDIEHGIEHVLADLSPFALERAIENYFHRLSRRPPNGGAAFNPYLSPMWAGLKLPG